VQDEERLFPSAWLMVTAKRRALDVLRRDATARRFAPALERELDSEWTLVPAVEEAFQMGLNDSQLRLMFSCAHPRLREEAQGARSSSTSCAASALTRSPPPS
jgi:RNA polymerase sigma-70 factor (ECF subfamily)